MENEFKGEEVCQGCGFWDETHPNKDQGYCRRFPAAGNKATVTGADAWCGEFTEAVSRTAAPAGAAIAFAPVFKDYPAADLSAEDLLITEGAPKMFGRRWFLWVLVSSILVCAALALAFPHAEAQSRSLNGLQYEQAERAVTSTQGIYTRNVTGDALASADPAQGIYVPRGGTENLGALSIVHKFGRANVGTSYIPVSIGGVWPTPQIAGATTLRVKAGGNANDTAAGTGARQVTLQGIDNAGNLVTETLATAGASASAATTNSFMRLFRVWVSESGTYASPGNASHAADIVIENSGGGTDWATIDSTGFARGQSEIGLYTVPNGYTAYIAGFEVGVEGTKAADVVLYKREGTLDTAAPYEAARIVADFDQFTGQLARELAIPFGPFLANTDIGFQAKVASGTAFVDVEFEIILEAD